MKQIAELAGVSPSTVSNVLHGNTAKMTAETFARVQRVISEKKYVANMSGRNLAKYGSKIIAVIMTYGRRNELNAIQDPFFSEIIGALEHEIRTRGYFMMLYISGDVDESLKMAHSWNVEGLVSIGGSADDCRKFASESGIPLVFIDCYFHNDGFPYVNVGLEDKFGGRLMTEYLIGKGHRGIAFLADEVNPVGVDFERLLGCAEAITDAGLSFSKDDYIHLSYKADERFETLKTLVHNNFLGYTALFFASDFLASDAINVFQDEGVRVPDDISVAGFDGNIFSAHSRPRITTVQQSVSQKAAIAAEQLFKIIKKEKLESPQIRLPVSLKIGESVKNLCK
jgi:LacI family transcriptional regulator